ncbi:UNVERIFIED_CONTAM: hypothetical protein FKN15_010307 [Acipenser sinensis]
MLIFSCSKDNQTTIIQNGDGLTSQFRFDAFRFLQHRDRKLSSIYLHCVTRLCQPSTCKELKAVRLCQRHRLQQRLSDTGLGRRVIASCDAVPHCNRATQ